MKLLHTSEDGPGRGSAAPCRRIIHQRPLDVGLLLCGTPLWVSTPKEGFLPIYGLFVNRPKGEGRYFSASFNSWISATSPSRANASSHTMKNMLKDLNHSPTYQCRREIELFPVGFVISLLRTNWGQKGTEVIFYLLHPTALQFVTDNWAKQQSTQMLPCTSVQGFQS